MGRNNMDLLCDKLIRDGCMFFMAAGKFHQEWHNAFDEANLRFDPQLEDENLINTVSDECIDADILGDQIEYNNVTYAEGKHEVMPLAATRGDCIISELISCLPLLFPTQDYSELENELATINSNVTICTPTHPSWKSCCRKTSKRLPQSQKR